MHIYSTLSSFRVEGSVLQLPIHESGSRADKLLSNWYQCTIPVKPVLASWKRDSVITPEEHQALRRALQRDGVWGGEWGSVEAAYVTLRMARAIWGDPDNKTLPSISQLANFLKDGKYTQVGYLQKIQAALQKGLSSKDSRVLSKARLKALAKMESTSRMDGSMDRIPSPLAGGAAAGAFLLCFLGRAGTNKGRPSQLTDQLMLWAPLHDAKFDEKLNPDLHAHLKKVVTTHRGADGQHLPVVFCEYNRITIRQAEASWKKNPWVGGVRIGLPHKDANDYEERDGEQYGLNLTGQLISACAHRLFKTPVMDWNPVERYMSPEDVTKFATKKAETLGTTLARVKRKSAGSGEPSKKRAAATPVTASLSPSFEEHVLAIEPAMREWRSKISAAQASMRDNASQEFSKHLDPSTVQQLDFVCKHVFVPIMTAIRECSSDIARECAVGSEKVGLQEAMTGASRENMNGLAKMVASMATVFS